MVLALAVAAAACGHPEQMVVDKYFGAVNTQDNQTLGSFASVKFDRKVDAWKITGSQPESRVPAPLPERVKAVKDLEAELAANKKAYGTYGNDHYTELDQVKEAQKKGAKPPAKLADVAAKWEEFTKKDHDLKKAVAEARDALEKEKRNVVLSVGPVDNVDSMAGELITKQLDLTLTVAGQPENYAMTLQKYEVTGGTGQRVISRWIITGLQKKS
jgi:hypothetical protein